MDLLYRPCDLCPLSFPGSSLHPPGQGSWSSLEPRLPSRRAQLKICCQTPDTVCPCVLCPSQELGQGLLPGGGGSRAVLTVSKELPLRQGEGGRSTQRTSCAETQKHGRGLLVTLASCRSPMVHGASRSPRQAKSWREKHRPLVSCKQEPSTLRGLLLGTGAFSGVCPHHRAEGKLPHLGLTLLFFPREGN